MRAAVSAGGKGTVISLGGNDITANAVGVQVQGNGKALMTCDMIKDVGPGGHFLAQKHTRRTIRDFWLPALTHPAPNIDGQPSPDIRQRAKATFERILVEHHPEPLPEDIQIELQIILQAAENVMTRS